jgi:hypothetical protein
MAHGLPDWTELRPLETVYALDDMGELAVRLGSIDIFDRLGNVIFLEDFENGLIHLNKIANGAGADITESGEHAKNGGFSAKLTTGSTAGNYAGLSKTLPYPTVSRIGFELSFTGDQDVLYDYFYMIFYTGSYKITFGIKYDGNYSTLSFLGQDGLWHVFVTGISQQKANFMFHTAKQIVNITTLYYVRLIYDSVVFDLSAYKPYITLDTTWPEFYIEGTVYNKTGVSVDVWIDDIIVTQNEP